MLVEMIVAMAVATMLLGMAVGLLGTLLRLEDATRARARATEVLAELARQFRSDAHAAVAAVSGRDGTAVALKLPGEHNIRYDVAAGEVIRREEGGPAAAREDSFRLPPSASARLDVSRVSSAPRRSHDVASLAIHSPGAAGLALRIEAAVARDHRFEKPKKSNEEE
jgi:type II secretory pathway pseudopilin PulG